MIATRSLKNSNDLIAIKFTLLIRTVYHLFKIVHYPVEKHAVA